MKNMPLLLKLALEKLQLRKTVKLALSKKLQLSWHKMPSLLVRALVGWPLPLLGLRRRGASGSAT